MVRIRGQRRSRKHYHFDTDIIANLFPLKMTDSIN